MHPDVISELEAVLDSFAERLPYAAALRLYALENGVMVSINDKFGPGQNEIPYGNGKIINGSDHPTYDS